MTTQSAQPAKNGLKTGILVLAAVALICASFLIGRFVANSSDDGTRQSSQDTSQVSEEDANEELDSTEPETVFDSTEEEIEEVKEEQEKAEAEVKEEVEAAKEEVKEETTPSQGKFTNSYTTPFYNNCVINILYSDVAEEPQTQLNITNLNSKGSNISCTDFDLSRPQKVSSY